MKVLAFTVGSVVDLFGEKCKVVKVYNPENPKAAEYDLESIELTDEDGMPAFYGRVKTEALN